MKIIKIILAVVFFPITFIILDLKSEFNNLIKTAIIAVVLIIVMIIGAFII